MGKKSSFTFALVSGLTFLFPLFFLCQVLAKKSLSGLPKGSEPKTNSQKTEGTVEKAETEKDKPSDYGTEYGDDWYVEGEEEYEDNHEGVDQGPPASVNPNANCGPAGGNQNSNGQFNNGGPSATLGSNQSGPPPFMPAGGLTRGGANPPFNAGRGNGNGLNAPPTTMGRGGVNAGGNPMGRGSGQPGFPNPMMGGGVSTGGPNFPSSHPQMGRGAASMTASRGGLNQGMGFNMQPSVRGGPNSFGPMGRGGVGRGGFGNTVNQEVMSYGQDQNYDGYYVEGETEPPPMDDDIERENPFGEDYYDEENPFEDDLAQYNHLIEEEEQKYDQVGVSVMMT